MQSKYATGGKIKKYLNVSSPAQRATKHLFFQYFTPP